MRTYEGVPGFFVTGCKTNEEAIIACLVIKSLTTEMNNDNRIRALDEIINSEEFDYAYRKKIANQYIDKSENFKRFYLPQRLPSDAQFRPAPSCDPADDEGFKYKVPRFGYDINNLFPNDFPKHYPIIQRTLQNSMDNVMSNITAFGADKYYVSVEELYSVKSFEELISKLKEV